MLVDLTCSGHEWGDFNCVDFSLSRHPWRTCAVHWSRESQGMKQQMVKVKDRIACWIPQVCVEDWFFTAAYNERDASVIDGVAST